MLPARVIEHLHQLTDLLLGQSHVGTCAEASDEAPQLPREPRNRSGAPLDRNRVAASLFFTLFRNSFRVRGLLPLLYHRCGWCAKGCTDVKPHRDNVVNSGSTIGLMARETGAVFRVRAAHLRPLLQPYTPSSPPHTQPPLRRALAQLHFL